MSTLQRKQQFGQEVGNSSSGIRMLIEEFCRYGDARLSVDTMRTRKTHLYQFSAYCDRNHAWSMHSLSNQFIAQYLEEYALTHARSTANTALRIIKVFIAWVYQYKEIDLRIYPLTVSQFRVKDTLPKAIDLFVVREVIAHCKQAQDAIAIALATEAGIRIGELVEIRVGDIHGNNILIHGKGDVERVVRITDALQYRISQFIVEERDLSPDYLLQNIYQGYGCKMNKATLRLRIQKEFLRTAGIHVTPHQLRHTFAVMLLTNGCDIVTVQRLMGHSDINTTRNYLRLTDTMIENAYDKAMCAAGGVLT